MSAPALWRKVIQVNGHSTELHGISCTSGPPVIQFVIFPGNPGSGELYETFMEMLFQALDEKADILAVSHLGHDEKSELDGHLVSLEEQIKHKASFLQEHVLIAGRPPVVIMGHSIGSYMLVNTLNALTTKVFEKRADTPHILKVICMFPFFEADFSVSRVGRLHRLSQYHYFWGLLGGFMNLCMPNFLRAAMFKTFAKDKLDEHVVTTCCKLLQRRTITQYFYLASCYVVRRPFDWSLLGQLGSKVVVYCCPNDTWMTPGTLETMKSKLPQMEVHWKDEMVHAFIVSVHRCQQAADLMGKLAKGIMEQQQLLIAADTT